MADNAYSVPVDCEGALAQREGPKIFSFAGCLRSWS